SDGSGGHRERDRADLRARLRGREIRGPARTRLQGCLATGRTTSQSRPRLHRGRRPERLLRDGILMPSQKRKELSFPARSFRNRASASGVSGNRYSFRSVSNVTWIVPLWVRSLIQLRANPSFAVSCGTVRKPGICRGCDFLWSRSRRWRSRTIRTELQRTVVCRGEWCPRSVRYRAISSSD